MKMGKINFNEEFISKIIDGTKIQTRRLVKENEMIGIDENTLVKSVITNVGKENKSRIKWEVGKTYAVCVNGKALFVNWDSRMLKELKHVRASEEDSFKQLKIKLTSIRKERLLEITEEEAKLEGFENKGEFILAFRYIYSKGKNFPGDWNPFVWRIEFEVLK